MIAKASARCTFGKSSVANKCEECGAPTGQTENGWTRFDSSEYHMAAVKKLSEISMWKGYAQDLESAMQEFIHRCEVQDLRGEVYSKYTYAKFKELISPVDESSLNDEFSKALCDLAVALDDWKNAGADSLTVVSAIQKFVYACHPDGSAREAG